MASQMIRLLCILSLSGSAFAATSAVDEMLTAFQTRLESGTAITDLCDSLEQLDSASLNGLSAELGKAWPGVRDRYLTALEASAEEGVGGDHNRSLIRDHRSDFMRVYAMGEGPMKPLLKKTSKPAVDQLRKLLTPTVDELVKAGPPSLAKLRQGTLKLATFRDATLDAALSSTPSDSRSTLAAMEKAIAEQASDLPRDGLRILEKNRKIAEDHEVPAEEAKGIEECNLWRLHVGLNALVLDPKLCAASRDHSKDMAEKSFFAHDSPVPGKATPWNRAANFGTTASGENIYMGSTTAHAANIGWFYSPGHHKNMFNAGQKRIGLGQHGRHWTQMFGR